jgi:hypothetical protein
MKVMLDLKKILLYALAIIAPGGFVAIAGYHAYKVVSNKKKEKEIK